MLINQIGAQGHLVTMRATHERHFRNVENIDTPEGRVGQDFGDVLLGAVSETSRLQNEASDLMVQSVLQPDAVDADDVALAASKANLSLSLMKAVVDRALRAYNEIINMR